MPPTTMRGEVEERRKGLSSGSWSDIFGLDALAYWYLVFWQSNSKMLMKKCVRAVRVKSNEWLLVLRTFWFHPFCKIRKKETPGILCGFVQRIDWLLTKQCLVGQTHIWGKGGPAASEVYIVFLCIWSLHSFTEYIVDAWMVLTAHSPRDNVRNLWTLG